MPRDQVRATPRNSALGALADFLAQSYSPERTQQMQGVAKFLDMPAISETIDRLSYDPSGRSLFTGAGGLGGTTRFRPEVLDAAMAVAPGAGALGKLAAQGTMAAGRAGARIAERAVPRIMERGGVGAEMLQGMSRNTVSPMDVYHGSPHKFDRFDASKIGTGEGNQAYGHGIYTAEAKDVGREYAKNLANRDVTNQNRLNAHANAQRLAAVTGDPSYAADDIKFVLGNEPDHPQKQLLLETLKHLESGTYKTPLENSGNLYKVDLPDEQIAKMLDWDKPLSEQPDVMKALKGTDYEVGVSQKEAEKIADMRLRQEADEWAEMTGGDPVDYSNNVDWEKYVDAVRKESGSIDSSITGKDLHRMVMRDEGYRPDLFDSENYQVGASETLRGMGIPGIKYLDATSRGAGQGTRNFVTFPGEEQSMTILERNGQPMVAPAVPEEHKMLQGFYRGYAGENLDTPELFVSPQKRIADYYADKRARQTGAEPHAEMVLMDPFAGETYGHSTMGSGAKAPMFTNAKKIKLEDIEGRTQLYQSGGVVKLLQGMLVNSGEKAITAAQRAAAGRAAAELIKSQEQVKASEALGQLMEKGFKQTTTTQADRTRVGGGNIGGAPFPALSQADPAYAGKVWGVMDEGAASRLKNLTTPDTAWTTMLGSAIQLKTNPVVFDKLKRGFIDSMKQGNLSDELAGKINHNLSLTFGKGADIRDPGIWKQADTFDKRAALADAMMGQGIAPGLGGVALGGEKSGRGVIFRPTDTLIRETEPYLLPVEFGGNVPTYAAGPRLFSLERESMYRPDLHPGFPTLIKGEDLGVNMAPTPTEVYLPDWHARFKAKNPERKAPGYYDLAFGVKGEGLPSQELNDAYIQHLLREGFAGGGEVRTPDMEFTEDPESSRLYKHAMKQFMPNQEDTVSTVSTGVQGRVGSGDLSAGIDMNRMTKGQQDQLMRSIAANYNVDLGGLNLNARLEAPLDAKDVYVGMLNGSIPIGAGRAMLGVQGIKTPDGSDVLGYNAGYSGKVGLGRLNVNVNKPKQGKPSAQVQYQIPFAEGGAVHFDEGGAAFGVFPQMKARRAQQDREAAANAPLSALRGWAAGTAGLPGDIEGLARAGISQLPPQLLTAFPALRAFGIGSRADPTPQLPTTDFYNEYLPGVNLNATPTGKLFTGAGNLLGGTGSTTLARYGIKSAKATAKAIAEAAPGPASGSRAAQLGVIKLPGGNFLKGEVEDSVSPMKARTMNEFELKNLAESQGVDVAERMRINQQPAEALNTFIDKKIAPYIRNEMATPDDPLRAMAEKYAVDKPVKLAEVQARIDDFAAKMEQTARDRGVPVEQLTSMRQQMIGLEKEKALVEAREGLHFNPDENAYSTPYITNRKKAGTDIQGIGQSPLARSWEDVSDSALSVNTAADILRYKDSFAPWLSKVPPETKVYRPRNTIEHTGFAHLVDELRNAINPESGLPKNLLIDPADLGKLTMPQAVDRVADINAWRATQRIEANQAIANNAATQVVKEYPEQGLKWVELKTPEAKLPEGVSVVKYGDLYHVVDDVGNSLSVGATEKEALNLLSRSERETTLADALKYEGDTMQHCVGGYCPDVVEGRSRIYSLRDDKGQPRVTIEVKPHEGWFTKADGMPDPSGKNKSFHELIDNERSELARQKGGFGYIGESYEDIANRLADQYGLKTDPTIAQIKGFRNKKPADEYLPMVQDFVKSGNWSNVGDLRHTGLRDLQRTPKLDEYLKQKGVEVPRYLDEGEYQKYESDFLMDQLYPKNDPQYLPPQTPEGMAQGGFVSNHFDPIKIKQIIAGLDDDYDPENIQQIIAQRESAYA